MKRTHVLLLAVVIIAAAVFIFGKVGGGNGTNEADKARQAIEAQGYTNIQYVGVDTFACGETAGFSFDAENVNRVRVRVIACAEGGNGLLNPVAGWRIVTR